MGNQVIVKNSGGGIGFVGLLTIAFIVLKLTKQIDWSWWWVWSPIWIILALFVVIFVIAFVAVTLDHFIKKGR